MEINKEEKLLYQVLEGKDDRFKAKVLNMVVNCGITADDPVFLLLIASNSLEVLLEESPQVFQQMFNAWTLEIEKAQDLVLSTTVLKQKEAIARAAAELIKNQSLQQSKGFFASIVPAAGVLLTAMGFGVLIGITVPPMLAPPLDPTGPRQLTLAEAEALEWATSKEGKLARNLVKWNAGWINGCESSVKSLGVEMTWGGQRAKSGFCFLWVKPPSSRQFAK